MASSFTFTELVPIAGDIISTKLGISSPPRGQYSSNDVGRAMKLSTDSNHVDCTSGDEIDGFITSVEPATEGGFSFGGIMQEGRKTVTAGGTIAIGALVVAGTQPAIATVQSATSVANLNNGAATQAVVIAGTPNIAKWRCIANVTSPGTSPVTTGQLLLIERV